MEEKIIKLQKRADEIMNSKSLNILSDEKSILEILTEISKSNSDNISLKEKTLNDIEIYLDVKEKMCFAQEDLEFLKKLSKNLKSQFTRITDEGDPTLFKITNSLGNEIYFLTRSSLEEYRKINEKDVKQLIEIPSSHSMELKHLLDIIKRNF